MTIHEATSRDEIPVAPPVALGNGLFQSAGTTLSTGRTFGGRIVCDALLAAAQTVDTGFKLHSLHVQFLRPADATMPVEIGVESLKDGQSYQSRMIRIGQNGKDVTAGMFSFAKGQSAPVRALAIPDVPGPQGLHSVTELNDQFGAIEPRISRFLIGGRHPLDCRPVNLGESLRTKSGRFAYWFRPTSAFPDMSEALNRAALIAYASDRFVLFTAILPHLDDEGNNKPAAASLDHALWLHQDYAPESWLLHSIEVVRDTGSRVFVRSEIFSDTGIHVASVAQEGHLSFSAG